MKLKGTKRPPASFTDTSGNEFVSGAELSRRVGVTQAAMTYARQRKWIKPVKKNDAIMFAWPEARDGYLANAPMVGAKGAKKTQTASEEVAKDEDAPEDEREGWSGRGRPTTQLGELQTASASKVAYGAALLQLEYEQRLGNMVPRDKVDAVWKGAGESLKKSLMSIPDRVAPQFGGKDSHKLYRVLVEELTHALANLDIKYDFPDVAVKGRPRGR